MKRPIRPALAAAACLGMAACHFPGSGGDHPQAPTGDVVATAGGQQLTVRDLRAEMAGMDVADPAQQKGAEQAALQRMVGRVLLAQAARAQGLDKTSDFAVQKQRALDGLLAQAIETRAADTAPAPTRAEAQAFVSAQPDIFAQRKIFTIDQLRMARPNDPKVLEALRPLTTLEDIAALLTKSGVKFQRDETTVDAVGANPRLVDQLVKLPPHEVFVVPSNGLILVNQIKDARVEPFTGEPAIAYALTMLKREHTGEAVQRQIDAILSKGAKSVAINKAYAPALPASRPAG